MSNFINEKPQSVILTDRDYQLLMGLYKYVVLSFPQLQRLYFVEKAKPTVINRLTKLIGAGLICKLKVSRLMKFGTENQISVVYQITRKGIAALQKRYFDQAFWPEAISLMPHAIDHDLILADVMAELERKCPTTKIVHGAHYSYSPQTSNGLKPDIMIFNPQDKSFIAVEVELTAKSEKRYRELILKYRLARPILHVLYISSHESINQKIKTILGSTDVQEKFKFVTLKEFLASQEGNNNSKPQAFVPERKEANV